MMRRVLDLVGGTLFIIWMIEYFGYNAGEMTHGLLLTAIIIFFVKTVIYLPTRGKI